jgi:hypothetical protein
MKYTFGQAFDNSQGLSAISLLKTKMYYVLLRADIIDIIEAFISKGVYSYSKGESIDEYEIGAGYKPKREPRFSTFMR